MDAKFFSPKPIGLSGLSLAWILTAGLILIAMGLDLFSGRSLGLSPSLTLPLCLAALFSSVVGFWAVPWLRALKTGQFIREEGPQAHFKKAGTPTMGGVFFVPIAIVLACLLTGLTPNVAAASLLTLAYAGIGWLDDWQVLCRQSNKGISPRLKLILQVGLAALFCLWNLGVQPETFTQIALPFGLTLPLGLLFWPLAAFVLVAESNATNLTDGLDGLMAGTGAIALLGIGALIAPTHPDLMVFCAALSGSCLGFLTHNRNPAKVFMGDTGSLAIGGALAAVGILSGNLFALLILSLIFFAETVSVIIQVSYYKATKGPDGIGKRFFRMAPLHHHLELSGWSETQVVSIFYAIGAFLALFTVSALG
ncbi:MAG: phospho-N-acetylmuramoyl-pentapeptide-transferase [Leptolyngbyaceae cyanobacterium MO_188.B28]|nr:phospho-N-acetylmuramoyl-pentapeptide-transferase [Leptolyngbyaceae cyanobacterium MO_188.B28]